MYPKEVKLDLFVACQFDGRNGKRPKRTGIILSTLSDSESESDSRLPVNNLPVVTTLQTAPPETLLRNLLLEEAPEQTWKWRKFYKTELGQLTELGQWE
jgi:hypothetical protein